MEHPAAVIEKAKKMEQLLLKLEAGISQSEACKQLGIEVDPKKIERLHDKYNANGRVWEALLDRRYGRNQQVTAVIRQKLYQLQQSNPTLRAKALAEEIQQEFGINISVSHINYLLRQMGIRRSAGRPSCQTAVDNAFCNQNSSEPLPNAGIFFMEAAKQAMGVIETVDRALQQAKEEYQTEFPTTSLRLFTSQRDTVWQKLDHLLYLPILGLKRPRDLFYYQGAGLEALYGFTYKYLPLEHFLGQLTRLGVGKLLASELAKCYCQAWYPVSEPLFIFIDWHVKPHWTKKSTHSGSVTMWGRIMPGTKQLLINGPKGHLLGGWNKPIDSHLSKELVELEAELATLLSRPIAYTIADSEAGGLPAAQRSASAEHFYISILPRRTTHTLNAFNLLGEWSTVENDPTHEAIEAKWHDTKKALADPRRLILMRRLGDTDPTRIYAGRIPAYILPFSVPARYRERWMAQERVIRELVNGANLNVNYGYQAHLVPNRTLRRRWDEAQNKVMTSEQRLNSHLQALADLAHKLRHLRQEYRTALAKLECDMHETALRRDERKAAGLSWRSYERHFKACQREIEKLSKRFTRKRRQLLRKVQEHRMKRAKRRKELTERIRQRDAIDNTALCRERDLRKDQIMLSLQVLLASLHDWVQSHYLAPEWQSLELQTATQLIYRKAGRVVWGAKVITIIFEAYRYSVHQQAMEESCRRLNNSHPRWRDGRLLFFEVMSAT